MNSDLCGTIRIRDKCLDSKDNKVQIWDCNDSSDQLYIYDINSKTIRPKGNVNLCVAYNGREIILEEYKNKPNQKFDYDSTTKRFSSNGNTKCIDLKNSDNTNGTTFQSIECKTHPAQQFEMSACSNVFNKDLQTMLDQLKRPAYDSIESDLTKRINDSENIGLSGVSVINDFLLYSSFYMTSAGEYTISTSPIDNSTPSTIKSVSMNLSPYIEIYNTNSNIDDLNKPLKLNRGINLIMIRFYDKVIIDKFNIIFKNIKNGSTFNLKDVSINSVENVPINEWLYMDLYNKQNDLVTVNENTLDMDLYAKYLNYTINPLSSYGILNVKKEESQLSKYSEWVGCSETCGFDSQIKSRSIIPSIYGSSDTLPVGDLEMIENCNKFCRTEADVLKIWKDETTCPVDILPPITKNKFIEYIDENKVTQTSESAVFIDNLRLYTRDQLKQISSLWLAPDTSDISNDCYGNVLSDTNILRLGGRIFSKDSVTYLEYSTNGRLSLFSIQDTGEYTETFNIRSTPTASNVGEYVRLVDGKLSFYKGNTLLGSITIGGSKSKILISSYCMFVIETISGNENKVLNIIGNPPYELVINDLTPEYKFVPKSKESNSSYSIISSDTTNLKLSFSSLEYIVDGEKKWSLPLTVNQFVCFNSKGFYIGDGKTKTFECKCNNVSLFSLTKETIEMKDSSDYIVRYYGNAPSNLLDNVKLKRPTNGDEEGGLLLTSSSGKSSLKYQIDGNLVFYSNKIAIWNSGTQNKVSTHYFMSASGEIFIMNGSEVVYRSNYSDSSSVRSIMFIMDDWFVICNSLNNLLHIARVYPNASDPMSASMTSVVKYHLSLNYDKYPNFSIKSVDGSETNTNMCENVINITDFLRSYNFMQCSPTDFFCNFTKNTTVNNGITTFNVEFDVNSDKWKNKVSTFSLVNAVKTTAFNYADSETFKYGGNKLFGYSEIVSSKYIGNNSSPVIKLRVIPSKTIDCKILIKDSDSAFADSISSVQSYRNAILNNKQLITPTMFSMLGFEGVEGFQMHSNFSMSPDMKSSFSNPLDSILNTRYDMLTESCSGPNILSNDCQNEKSILEKNNFYNSNMNLECRKDFNNTNCLEYVKKNNDITKFIDSYCDEGMNAFNSQCRNACSNYNGLLSNCIDNFTIYLFILLLVLVSVLVCIISFDSVKSMFKKSTTKDTQIKTSTK
jgi:Ricin-type beta-trefoil lectin domain